MARARDAIGDRRDGAAPGRAAAGRSRARPRMGLPRRRRRRRAPRGVVRCGGGGRCSLPAAIAIAAASAASVASSAGAPPPRAAAIRGATSRRRGRSRSPSVHRSPRACARCRSALRDAQEAADDVRVALAEPAATAKLMGWLPLVAVLLGVALGFDTFGTLLGSSDRHRVPRARHRLDLRRAALERAPS